MNASQHSASIKGHAAELGFDACAVARAERIDPEHRLDEWLESGYHADMDWLDRTKDVRQDVGLKLPGARSVVVVARNYHAQRPAAETDTGRVSRYAWGRDYHRVLRKPLRALAERIESLVDGVQTYCCIDSGPVLERFWAARSGLGWIGKNSLVLRSGLGSWFFLGVIVTTLDIAPDAPVADLCGACTRCIDACPTNAIVKPRVVDSRRCISYHTIENRGDIPAGLHKDFDDWVFGCDTCQEVCPWNKDVPVTNVKDFHARPGHAHPALEWLEEMDTETFTKAFAGTPVMRARLEGMKRNASIVRANQHKHQK